MWVDTFTQTDASLSNYDVDKTCISNNETIITDNMAIGQYPWYHILLLY